jgi:hypothetical protein
VHALAPVPLAFRAYYKVEVPQDSPEAVQPVQAVEVPAPSEPVYDAPVAEPVEAAPAMMEPVLAEATVDAGAPSQNGKRSLGFFAH